MEDRRTTAASAVNGDVDSNIVSSQVAACAVIVWTIQYLKLAKWFPALNVSTDQLNRIVSALLALGAASALHFAFDSQSGRMVIDGITTRNLLHLAWATAVQFTGQQLIYDAVYHPPRHVLPAKTKRQKRK